VSSRWKSDYPAFVHQDHFGAAFSLVEVCGAEQHAGACIANHPVHDRPELAAGHRVHADRWLVKQQQARRAQQHTGQTELLFHAARQPAGQAVHERGETRQSHELVIAGLPLDRRESLQIRVEIQVFFDAEVFVQAEALGHVAHHLLNRERLGADIETHDPQLACVRQQQATGQAHESGLAGRVRSDQSGDLAPADLQVDIVQRGGALRVTGESLGQTRGRQHDLAIDRGYGGHGQSSAQPG
jgi:hypothetical protein